MDRLLGPGMRLMRRLRVAAKFVAVLTLLVVPLSLAVSGPVRSAGREVSAAARERQGLTMARPLALLVLRIDADRFLPAGVRDLGTSLSDADAADRAVGSRLGVHGDWLRVRALVSTRPADAAARATELLRRVADVSGLTVDPQLDSRYLVEALVDRVPLVLDRVAPPPAVDRDGLLEATNRLTTGVGTALNGTSWPGLVPRVSAPVADLRTAVARYAAVLAGDISRTAPRRGRTDAATPVLAAAATPVLAAAGDLVRALADAVDVLLAQRGVRLRADRDRPLVLFLLSLVAAGWVFGALYRATTGDVRRVLADINSLTGGVPNETEPMTGPDEFAQMSRAVVSARDRLTSLLGSLRYQSTHDELTALGNRVLFTEKLAEALADPDRQVGVVVIDLDAFKDINDSFGHVIGDRLLRTIGARFHRVVTRQDLVARIGADQFGVLLADAADDRRAAETLESLRVALEQPVDLDGRQLRTRASIGIALSSTGGRAAGELMRNADVAMHAAKGGGAGRLAVFEPAMHEATRRRTELSYDLVQAFEAGQLSVAYQPIVDIGTEVIHGVEALVRWTHPVRGPIPPADFVPLAEATGLILPIDRWVRREAAAQLAEWHERYPACDLTMEVNMSPDQLNDPELVGDLLSLINETGIDPTRLVLEITESALIRDLDGALRRLGQLSAAGIRIALDDFGTGYSSLSHLRRLPVSILKIDKSFVTDSDDVDDPSGSGERLLRTIVQLGTGLRMQVVAEGVETRDQLALLRQAGCQLGQGFLWSQAVEPDAVEAILARGGAMAALPRPRASAT
jgi:diguanylate cyclase (GGDEF)-like protein